MITSEVQRTLVKSPPELWTELSDPESLARHLAELGEIKITRVEPEKRVEWEAGDTTGSVAIKASGWGTKVTLTVERELPGPLANSSPTEGSDPGPTAEAALETQTHTDAAKPSPTTRPEPADDPAPTEPATETTSDPKPAPATEAARRAAGWPAAKPDPGPAIESDLRAAEATAGGTPAARQLTPWHIDTPVAADSEPPEPALQSPEPRRGFLTRLFGGRRRKQAQKPQLDRIEPSPTLSDELLAAVAVAEPEAEESRAPEPSVSEPIVVGDPMSAPNAIVAADPAGERGLAAEREPIIAAEPEAVSESKPPVEPSPPAGEDLAAELRAAEETAEEQVKAVLTGVLDRLGAAHHRPFSRA